MKKYLSLVLLLFCILKCEAQTIENPVFDRTEEPAFHIDKVEITKDTTCIYCSYNAVADSWANISKETYLRDVNTNKIYPLLKCEGLPYGPDRRTFSYKEKCKIKLFFKSIPNGSKFDLIEKLRGRAFNVFGIDLKNQFKDNYNESYLNRLLNMSSFYDSANDTIKSIQYKKELIEAQSYNFGKLSDVTFFSLLGLCVLYDKYGYQKETINLIRELSILQETPWGESSLEFYMLRSAFAENYLLVGYYDKIIETIKDAILLYKRLKIEDNVYAFLLRNNADYYNAIGDEMNFVVEQKRCLEVRRKLGDERPYLEDLLTLLIRNAKPEQYADRLNIIEKEMESFPNFVNVHSYDYAYFLKVTMLLYEMVGNNKKVVELCNQVISILETDKNRNKSGIAEIMWQKCRSLSRIGQPKEAIKTGEMAIELLKSLGTMPDVYRKILDELADLYRDQLDYEKAILATDQIISIEEKEENWIDYTKSLLTLGNYYDDKGDLEEAEIKIKKALEVINQHDRPVDYLQKDIELNPNYMSMGDPNVTLANYNDMILSIKSLAYGSLGFVLSSKGQFGDAIVSELKAGEIMKIQMDNNTNNKLRLVQEYKSYALHLLTLSRYYSREKQYKESDDCAKESIEYFKKGESPDYYQPYLRLAENRGYQNDFDNAIYFANEALSISNSSDNKLGQNKSLLELAIYSAYKEDFPQAEKYMSKALDYLQNTITSEIVNMKSEQRQRLWNSNEYLFLSYRDIVYKNNWNREYISKLLNYTLFSKSLLLDSDGTNSEVTRRLAITWKEIQQELTDKDIAIEFVTTQYGPNNKSYHALVIDKKSDSPNMITLFSESDLEPIKQYGEKIDLNILGDLIWKPILNQYEQIDNIYFSADGLLHLHPIEYCYVDGIGEMAECYNIYRLSSTKEIVIKNTKGSDNKAFLYGGLDYDIRSNASNHNKEGKKYSLLRSINARGGFEPLYNTLEEVKEIGSILESEKVSTSLYTGKEGTEDSFKDLSGKDFKILHLSTHGMYVEPTSVGQKRNENNFDFLEFITNENDPVKEDIVLTHSFLVMSGGNKLNCQEINGIGEEDGILTAFEISHVDLSFVDIVVLSACETGLGDIENGGVYGLQRGFKKAGVNTILMSLDKVDDEATKILMVEFYRNLMEGKSKHQSLKDAQAYLRQVDNGKYDKPEYWTSFILLDGLN